MHRFPQSVIDFVTQHQHKEFKYPHVPAGVDGFNWILDHSQSPWLALDIPMPCVEMLSEARALRSRFVEHRTNDSKGWRSLCIHGLAPHMTENHTHYGLSQEQANYGWTEIAEVAPVTAGFFRDRFPYTSYQRVRFMLIEPGGYILPHSDSTKNFLGLAINISLNNPQGCRLVTERGTVPFSDQGSVIMFNNHYRHCVINDSDQDRYHVIVHGSWSHDFCQAVTSSYHRRSIG